jgi:hypothetical protein
MGILSAYIGIWMTAAYLSRDLSLTLPSDSKYPGDLGGRKGGMGSAIAPCDLLSRHDCGERCDC